MQIHKLRYFFLKELPSYFTERINEIIDEKDIENYVEELKLRYGVNVVNSERAFCKSISVIVAFCLKLYGFNAILCNIKLMLGNKKAQEIFEMNGLEGLLEEKQKGDHKYYTLGIGFTENSDDFHTIILVNNNILLDMTANQMKRIEKGIIINNYWCSMEALKKKYKCILIYEILEKKVNENCLILKHPDLKKIINYILKKIAINLNLPEKKIVKYYHLLNV